MWVTMMSDHDHPDTDLTDPHGEAEELRRENARLKVKLDRREKLLDSVILERTHYRKRVEAAEAIKAEFAAVIRRLGGVPFMRSIVEAQRNANGAYILYEDGSAIIKVNFDAKVSPVKIPYDAAALDRPTAQARAQGMREAAVIAAHRYAVCDDAYLKRLGEDFAYRALEAKHIEDEIRARAEEIEKEDVSATWSAAIKDETAWSPETNSTPWCLLTVEQMRAFEASTGQMMRLRQDGEWHPHNGNGIGIVSDTYRIRKGGAE